MQHMYFVSVGKQYLLTRNNPRIVNLFKYDFIVLSFKQINSYVYIINK